MFQKKNTGRTRVVAFLLAAAILGGLGTAAFAADDEEGMKDVCRNALKRCMADAVKTGFFGSLLDLVVKTSACLAGYDFCLRFVQVLAEEMV